MKAILAQRIRTMSGWHWLALFGLILGAWLLLYLMALPADLRAAGALYGPDFWRDFCTLTPDAAGFGKMALMWVLMSAAMMAPTALPAFATYEDLSHASPDTNFTHLVAGYLSVWLGFALLAALMQLALFQADLLTAFGDSNSRYLSAALLLLAGGYQFSALKEACLSKCRRPLVFFMQHWADGPLRNGLRLGLTCLGCCWALMLLGFVGGTMNIAFMGLATVIMILEKLPDLGRHITRPLGVALVVWGLGLGAHII
jgi:predicted metal-binding membrane protein